MSSTSAFFTCQIAGCPMNTIAMVLMSWALLLAQPTYADFTGKVVKVADGDTITVLRDSEQIKQGMAGVYRKYTKEAALYQLEDEAKKQRLGLWADAEPTPPWAWRKM